MSDAQLDAGWALAIGLYLSMAPVWARGIAAAFLASYLIVQEFAR